jgi:uncharacterized RDD family membrane protein YckC
MMPASAAVPRTKASNLDRFVGAFIDGIILVPVYIVLFFIPIIGWIVGAAIGTAWWLLRDAKGISIGKKVMNLEVVSKDGGPATQDQLMKRNFTMAAAAGLGAIPIVGLLGSAISLVEGILVLAKGERYGDTMANTMVVKKG